MSQRLFKPPLWDSPQWQEAVSQNPGLASFFENLDSFVELPDGVEKLRGLLLELAVTGRLQTQSEDDAPSSLILKSLRAKKAQRIEANDLKQGKPVPA